MKEESEEKKEMKVSEKWREKHEGRMKTVGVRRMERGEGEEKGDKVTPPAPNKEKPTPLSTLDKINSLGGGWEW